MSLLGTSLFKGGAIPASPNANAAPSIPTATLQFDIFGNRAPTAQDLTLSFDVPAPSA